LGTEPARRLLVVSAKLHDGNEEPDMARIVIRCRYTGHYIISSHDAGASPSLSSGRIFCPYCAAEHVWTSTEASASERDLQGHPAARRKPLVRQAS
jgi:hypothetical protein